MIGKFIEVHDDIISPELANYLEKLFLGEDIPWAYMQNITDGNSSTFLPGFSYNFINQRRNLYGPFHFNISQVLYTFSTYLHINIIDIIQARSFLQLPSLKPRPNSIHVDLEFPHWVVLYYINDSDGDTILFDDNNNEIKRITPKKNRIAFFDGSIKHCSSSPSKTHRVILNFDFIGNKL